MNTATVAETAVSHFTRIIDRLPTLPESEREKIAAQMTQAIGEGVELTAGGVSEGVNILCQGGRLDQVRRALKIVEELEKVNKKIDSSLERIREEHIESLPTTRLLRRFEKLIKEQVSDLRRVSEPNYLFGGPGSNISDSEADAMHNENAGREAAYHRRLDAQEDLEREVALELTGIVSSVHFAPLSKSEHFKDALKGLTEHQAETLRNIICNVERKNEIDLSEFHRLIIAV